ncbi:hypothetical protein SETIT_7G120600v2 [Setaria italica]|uniref:DUF6598 domain-containing protein n=1 Tax=Setaria italica TaxID=4555 RepID=A0A368RUY4_SETIT|nr:hypothetical protein SETIT_7G120600v2 [Setaria italica]
MGLEVQLKKEHKVETQEEDEATKKRKIELDPEERKRLAEAEGVAKFKWLNEVDDEEELTDYYAYQAKQFRRFWESLYLGRYGYFEDETTICAKRFTDKPARGGGCLISTLQIFSVKVTGLSGGLKFPLDVYGMVAIRDNLDHNRNIIFHRKRDNCQTLTQEDLSLVLTGPVRAVDLLDPVIFEVELKVKSNIESQDRVLSLLAPPLDSPALIPDSCMFKKCYTSKLSTMELTVGHIFYSLEATISVKVIEGSWLEDSHGQFTASTDSIEDEKVVLLGFGDGKVPLDGDNILLSRSVVSAEYEEHLIVSVNTRQSKKAEDEAVEEHAVFTPLNMGRSYGELNVGFCKMQVTVAWSELYIQP